MRVPASVRGSAGKQALNSAGAGYGKNEDHVGRSRNEDRVGRRQSVEQADHSQQRWQPLEDGRWGRVVGRVGRRALVGGGHGWKRSSFSTKLLI